MPRKKSGKLRLREMCRWSDGLQTDDFRVYFLGLLNGFDASEGEAPSAVFFSNPAASRVSLKVVEHSSEHRGFVVSAVGVVDEVCEHHALLKSYFFDAESSRQAADTRNAEKFGGDVRNFAEAVDESRLKCLQVKLALDAVELLVERDALALLRYVVGREKQLHVAFDDAIGHEVFLSFGIGGCELRIKFFGAKFGDGFLENFLVCFVAEVGNKTALFGTEKVSGTANVEVLHGNVYATSEVAETLDGLKTTSRRG